MIFRLAGRVTEVSAPQLKKALESMRINCADSWTLDREVHPSNAQDPIRRTLSAMVTRSSAVNSRKA